MTRVLEIETLLKASRFSIERIKHRLADGREAMREIVRHPGAVVILPILEDGRICLIKNYRVAVNQVLLELPAGTLEPDEPPIETAKRELIEETGYRCSSLIPLCEFYMSPGILDERMYAFVATGLTGGDPKREFGEEIENLLVTADDIDVLLAENKILDSKSISTLLYYMRFASSNG